MHLHDFEQQWPRFREWLEANGAEVLSPTNSYEAARFRTAEGIGVIYMDADRHLTKWVRGAWEAWDAWKNKKPWRATPKPERKSRAR